MLGLILGVLTAGCGSADSAGGPSPAQLAASEVVSTGSNQVQSQGAELRLDFNQPQGGSAFSPSVDTLSISGFDQSGTLVFGPQAFARPANDLLTLNLHSSLATLDLEGFSSRSMPFQQDTPRVKLRLSVQLTAQRSHQVVVVVNGGGLTPVVNPPIVTPPSILELLPASPSLPATFISASEGSVLYDGTRVRPYEMLVSDFSGRVGALVRVRDLSSGFSLASDRISGSPEILGTRFSGPASIRSVASRFSNTQSVYLQLYSSLDGNTYTPVPYFLVLVDPNQAGPSGQDVDDFPSGFPLRPNIRYVWAISGSGPRVEGTLSVAAAVTAP